MRTSGDSSDISPPEGVGRRRGPPSIATSRSSISCRPTRSSSNGRKRCCRKRSATHPIPRRSTGVDEMRDEFLSEEDLDLANLSWDELIAQWNAWLRQAQSTNDADANEYSHGVFMLRSERLRSP